MTKNTDFYLEEISTEQSDEWMSTIRESVSPPSFDCVYENEDFVFDMKKVFIKSVSFNEFDYASDNTYVNADFSAHLIILTIKSLKKTPMKVSISKNR